MRRKHLWHYFTIGMCLFGVVCAPTLLGDDQAPPSVQDKESHPDPATRKLLPAPDLAGAEVLRELVKLREEVGESVLSGTVLEASPEESRAEFARGVRKVLGLSEDTLVKQNRAAGTKTPQEIVKTLRAHCVHLDRIAREIEELRQYDNADQLRETAQQLRLIARQFHK